MVNNCWQRTTVKNVMSTIMFVIFALLFTTVLASSHEKYIDLLPDAEKQEFLDKVARRIMEAVGDVEEGQISRELTDDQLKGHSKFVQEILKEETENFKRDKAEQKEITNENLTKENLKVKPLISNKNQNSESTKIKNIKRPSNNGTVSDYSTDYVKVEIITDNAVPAHKRTPRNEDERKKTVSVENVSKKIQEGGKLTADKFYDSEIYRIKTTREVAEPNSKDNLDLDIQRVNEAESIIKSIPLVNHEISEIESSTVAQSAEKNAVTNDEPEENDKNENFSVKTEKATHLSYSITSPNFSELNVATTVEYAPVSENPVQKKSILTASAAASTELPILTTTNKVNQTGDFLKKEKVKKIVKQTENTRLISIIASNALKKSKEKYILNRKKVSLYKNLFRPREKDSSPYQVYEVPWPAPGESPFLRSPEPVKDSPLRVPVYKYSPNHAYYNPTNRLGPNAVEENSIELETRPLREGEQNIDEAPSEFILKLDDEMRKFANYHNSKYDDITPATTVTKKPKPASFEYSFEFTHLPDSDEKRHPVNSMKDGLKTHIGALREILHKHHHFRPDGPAKKKKYFQYLYGDQDIIKKYGLDKPKKNKTADEESEESEEHTIRPLLRSKLDINSDIDIAMDYYFGRMKEKNEKTNKHLKNSKNVKNNNEKPASRMIFIYNKDVRNSQKTEESEDLNRGDKIFALPITKDIIIDVNKIPAKQLEKIKYTKIEVFNKILKKFIQEDSKSVRQYDWLRTAIQVQSSLQKLLKIIKKTRASQPLHPTDIEILNYVKFLYDFGKKISDPQELPVKLQKQLELYPNNNKNLDILKETGFLKKILLVSKELLPALRADNEMDNLNEFLLDVQFELFDFHHAVANMYTRSHKQQDWYEYLKMFLAKSTNNSHKVILHLFFNSLVQLINNYARSSSEYDFVRYVKSHELESVDALEMMVYVIKVIEDIKNEEVDYY